MFIQFFVIMFWIPLSVFFIYYSIQYRNLNSLKFITIAILLQNLMSLFAINTINTVVGQFVVVYKELVFILVFLISLNLRLSKSSILLFLFCIFLLISFIQSNCDLYARTICLRQIFTPFILLIYARSLNITRCNVTRYINFLIKIGIVVSIAGLVEKIINGESFWLSIDVSKIFEAKGFSNWIFNGLPGNYYSYDFYQYIGHRIFRLVGLTTDPLLTSHFLALCLTLLIFNKRKKNVRYIITAMIFVLSIIMTLSKGAIVILAVVVIYKVWFKNRLISLLLIILFFVILVLSILFNSLDSISIHVKGFIFSIMNASFLGYGLGSVGNLASIFSSIDTPGESYFALLIGQLGILGVLFYFSVLCYYAKKMYVSYFDSNFKNACNAYLIGLAIESLFSESSINFVGSGVVFILLGLYSNNKVQQRFIGSKD